jgi:PAS domain S-box-containing protein
MSTMAKNDPIPVDDQSLFFRQVVDSSPALLHTSRLDGYLDFFNQTWLDFAGVPLEKLLGWGWTSSIHPEDVQALVQKMRESFANGKPFQETSRVRRADGVYRWMLHQKVPIFDGGGNIVKWCGSSIDIDDRTRAEAQLTKNVQELQRSEFYLAEAQRLGHIGSWVFDPATGFEHWSRELFQIHGLDPAKAPPNSEQYLAAVHPQDREFMASLMNRMLSEDLGFDVTKRIVRAGGEVRYVRCVGTAASEYSGSKRIGLAIDVTEHEVLTQELRRREAHLAEAQRLGHIGSWVFEPAGAFEYWSDELFRIYGLDPERDAPTLDEYLGRVHPLDHEFMAALIKRMLAEGAGCDVTKRIVRPGGEVRHIRCVGAPVLENGTLKRIVGSAIDVTEHEILAQELRRRQAYLAEAQRLSHTGSFGWKPGSGEHAWSDETYRIFEYDAAEKVTLGTIMERVHPEDRNLVHHLVERASTSGGAIDCEYRLLFPDDRVKYVRVLARPLGTASDDLEFVGAVIDITEAKRAEEKIRLSERELRTLVEAIPAYVGTNLADGSVDFISQSWLDYTGFSREQGMDWGWGNAIHPQDFDRVLANWRAAVAAGTPVEHELRCRCADGTYHWFLYRGLPLRDDGGKVVKWYGTLTNIDALKETESALQMRELELLGIIETIPSMLWSTSPAGEPTHNSQRLLEYVGASFEDFVNRGWMSFIHPDDREQTVKAFFRAIETGESYNVISRLRRADGEYRWHQTRGEALRDPHGKIIQWYGLSIDIDERKRAEDHLRDTRIKLAKASRLATVAELAGSIAHELNQPLMSILANAQAAKRWLNAAPPNVAEVTSSIERVIRDARAADETMQHIRALFKQESFDKKDVNIPDIIREVVRVVQEDPKKRDVPIECHFAEPLPAVSIDQIQIQQVFINLIVNAIEALEGQQVTPLVTLRAAVTDSHRMLIQVIDNGPGVDDPERIFDAFMTTKEKGMGIGLAVSRSIVEAHGGRLWAENDKTAGVTFNVALPLPHASPTTAPIQEYA